MRAQRNAAVSARPNPAFLKLKRARLRKEGREERIQKALRALEKATLDYGLDADTIRWLAESPDLEGL
jgi:hypothetical protein